MDEKSSPSTVESRLNRVTLVVEQIGELAVASSETVEQLSQHLETVSTQIQQQQQSNIVLAEAVQALTISHNEVLGRLDQLIEVLNNLVLAETEE